MTLGPGLHRTKLPLGFLASGVNCGVRRYRPDLGLVVSDRDAVAVGVFTENQCKGAPVTYCQSVLPSPSIRAIVTNSGQANAATGEQGIERNLQMVRATAAALDVSSHQVLAASTGVIGVQMEIEKISAGLPELVSRASNIAENFALAILTTDLVPKSITTEVPLSQGKVRLTGICKGSGMIHPNMATMLGYFLTDLRMDVDVAQTALREAVDVSFNMISVDGDSSTNDCCFLMANGAANVELLSDSDMRAFRKALIQVAQGLAQAIAADGEGATKLVEVQIKGAASEELARRVARGLVVSPLIKTAMHGEDPNWGRILARLGAEQVPAQQLTKLSLSLQGVVLFEKGQAQDFVRAEVKEKLRSAKVKIVVDLKSGPHQATAWGCDLSKRYVEINTEYS